MLYTFGATYVVWKTLTKYGANWLVYFIIDVPTSWFYGISASRLVVSVIKKRFNEVTKWGWLAAINFAIPQIYILYYAHHASRQTLAIFAVIITGLAISSAYTLWVQIKKAKNSQ